jgi:hypothetical protein
MTALLSRACLWQIRDPAKHIVKDGGVHPLSPRLEAAN